MKLMKNHKLTGSHACTLSVYGDWRLSPQESKLYLKHIEHLLTDDRLQDVLFDDIAWKGMHLPIEQRRDKCICCNGVRYFRCDINYPPILCIHTPNPFNKKYRLLDGKHRIEKMLAQHKIKSRFYVLEYTDIEQFLVQKQDPNYGLKT